MTEEQVLPLSQANKGDILTLVNIQAGNRLNHRLADLGLTPGVCIEIMQDSGGPLLLSVRNSRVAIGRGMADKIMVRNGHGEKNCHHRNHRPKLAQKKHRFGKHRGGI